MAPDGSRARVSARLRSAGPLPRAIAGFAAIVLAALILALPFALLLGGNDPPEVQPARVIAAGQDLTSGGADPFAYDTDRRAELEASAAAGNSHVLYALSPGGVLASAERTARFRDEIEDATAGTGIDPDILEAMVFLESAGRPQVIAGDDPEAAAGLAQIVAETGTGLLGMGIDLERSRKLTRKLNRAARRGVDERRQRRLLRERAEVDPRFDPESALTAAVRYLETARARFARDDLAVESYHMGIGNLEDVIRAYTGAEGAAPVAGMVESEGLSYAQLYFDTTPGRHPEAHRILTGFADESAEYYWKVLAAREIMRLYREDRSALERLVALHGEKATAEEVFHPEDETEVFDTPDEIADAIEQRTLVPLPESRGLGFRLNRRLGELAPELGADPELYRALRPEALAALLYLSERVRAISGQGQERLIVTSAARDRGYQELLVGRNPEATDEYSLHTTGWSFDVLRRYESKAQARAFQFVLDRLKSLAVIDYAKEPRAIHVTVSDAARALVE